VIQRVRAEEFEVGSLFFDGAKRPASHPVIWVQLKVASAHEWRLSCRYFHRSNVAKWPDRRDPRLKSWSPGSRSSMYPYVASRGPTYRENSHANHTWQSPSHQTFYFIVPDAPPVWVRFPSPAPFSGNADHAGLQDSGQDIDPMGKSWESTLKGRRFHGLRYPRIAPRFTRTVTRSSSQN